jgi:16S rRNA (adenine1518-N6/adenine1519-N6)-dimethyltransferase
MRAKRRLGQNFLVDPNLQRKIVNALEPLSGDTIVEIGPGRGALTRHLADTGARLLAIELDDDLAADLAAEFQDRPNITIIHTDILDWDPRTLPGANGAGGATASGPDSAGGATASGPDPGGDAAGDLRPALKVVGNIPYNITSPILFRLLEWPLVPERIVLMVQKEVAERILATPGEKAYGALTVGVQAQARVERLFHVGRQAFRPVPGVDSTVIRIWPRPSTHPGTGEPLRSLTRAAFGMRRKQLQKILRSAPGYGLESAAAERVLGEVGLQPEDRPETLEPHTFVRLAAALERLGYP